MNWFHEDLTRGIGNQSGQSVKVSEIFSARDSLGRVEDNILSPNDSISDLPGIKIGIKH